MRLVCLGRPDHFKFFKGCLSQILFGPFLNTLTHILLFLFYEAYCLLICPLNSEVYDDLLEKLDEKQQSFETLDDELTSDQYKDGDYDENSPEYIDEEFKNVPSSMKGPDRFPIDPFAVNEISKMDGTGLNYCIVPTIINKIYLTIRSENFDICFCLIFDH